MNKPLRNVPAFSRKRDCIIKKMYGDSYILFSYIKIFPPDCWCYARNVSSMSSVKLLLSVDTENKKESEMETIVLTHL